MQPKVDVAVGLDNSPTKMARNNSLMKRLFRDLGARPSQIEVRAQGTAGMTSCSTAPTRHTRVSQNQEPTLKIFPKDGGKYETLRMTESPTHRWHPWKIKITRTIDKYQCFTIDDIVRGAVIVLPCTSFYVQVSSRYSLYCPYWKKSVHTLASLDCSKVMSRIKGWRPREEKFRG